MSLRTWLIQRVMHTNEMLVFYPKLKKFYVSNLKGADALIIDVGANKGQSIDFFLSIVNTAQIHAFEPNKKLFNLLENKYKQSKNIHLYNQGVSSKKGKLMFHENVLDETSTFEQLNFDSKYLEKKARYLGVKKENIIVGSYEVDVTTLADFINERPGISIDVLKIDIEGHELHGLMGLFDGLKGPCPVKYLQLESHQDDMYLETGHEKIAALLAEKGFSEVARIKHGFGDFYEIIYQNTNP